MILQYYDNNNNNEKTQSVTTQATEMCAVNK